MSRAQPTSSFWRCDACGTPNPPASYLTFCVACGASRPANPAPHRAPAPRPRRGRRLDVLCGLYAAALLGLWACVRIAPAGFWPARLALYGPRWVLPLPVLVLAPLALRARSRRAALALGGAMAALVALSGYNVPWARLAPGGSAGPTLRVLSCNVQGGDLRASELADLIRSAGPDVVLLQEWNGDDPLTVLGGGAWHVRTRGELVLASRHPIADFEALCRPDKPHRAFAVRADVLWEGRSVPVVGVHLMTPRRGLEAILRSPRGGLAEFRDVAAEQGLESSLLRRWVGRSADGPVVLAGDFNLSAEQPLYRRDWSSLADAFARVGWGPGSTMNTRLVGLRIDHVLCGADWRPSAFEVGRDVGSAHRPVLADLTWAGSATGE